MGERRILVYACAWLALAVLLPAGDAGAEIYRCTKNGHTSFRDQPCGHTEKQARIGGMEGALAGCYEIEDVDSWDGGSGAWRIRIASNNGGYELLEYSDIGTGEGATREAANAPMRRATPEDLEMVAQRTKLRVTSGLVLSGAADAPVSGLFNAWDTDGQVRTVGMFAFVNGYARRAACP